MTSVATSQRLERTPGRPGASLSHTVFNLMGVKPSPRVRTLNECGNTDYGSLMVTKFDD